MKEIAGPAMDLLLETETMRLAAIPEAALNAEQWQLKGIIAWQTFSMEAFAETLRCHDRAIALRPGFADACAMAIIVCVASRNLTRADALDKYRAKMPDWLEAARGLAPGHVLLTYAVAMATCLQDKRRAPLNRALYQVLRPAPFDARSPSYCGWAYLWSGQTEQAYTCFLKSLRSGMQGPFAVAAYGGAAKAAVQLGEDDAAFDLCSQGLALSDGYPTLHSVQAEEFALRGNMGSTHDAMQRFPTLDPDRTLRQWRKVNDYADSPGQDRYFDALILAGLPKS